MNHESLTLRRATANDMALYFEWANDPEVRRNAFQQEAISLENHIRWFAEKNTSPRTYMFVLECEGIPSGQIRFDAKDETQFEIDFSIAPAMRGQGWGALLLKLGIGELTRILPGAFVIYGEVKRGNLASAKAFLSAGFTEKTGQNTNPTIRYFWWGAEVYKS